MGIILRGLPSPWVLPWHEAWVLSTLTPLGGGGGLSDSVQGVVKAFMGVFQLSSRGRINWFCKNALESFYLIPRKVHFELKSHNLLPLSIWFHSDLLSQSSIWFLSNGLAGIRESPSGYEGKFTESRAGGSGREYLNEIFEILSTASLSFLHHPPAVTLFSLPRSQPNLVKSPHFLTCHSLCSPLHSDFHKTLHPRTPLSSWGPWCLVMTFSVLILLALPGTGSHYSHVIHCLCFLLQICSSFPPCPRCWPLKITSTGPHTFWLIS